MRDLIGRTPVVLARRWLRLERLATVTLRRDAYAETPGPSVSLAIGERTAYRAAAWLLDTFERAALGPSYPAWGGSAGLALAGGLVGPASVGSPGMAAHTATLPREQWAAAVIGALTGGASVGLLLRATDADAYRITASPTSTLVERITAGVPATLASASTAWRAGETLRVVVEWDRLRVYREPILVLDVLDAGLVAAGRAGLVASHASESDAAGLAAFVAGASRHEYLGAGLDLGDVSRVLGQPVTFDLTVSNLAAMGGKDRFAALLRHGLNTLGTYDLDRGDVTVLTVVDGGTAPLVAGVGRIDAPADVGEDRVKLTVRGRDAFLTPKLTAGPVTYLAGPPPGGLTPTPPDPCAPSAPPVIIAGPVPAEPETPPGDDGIGPEAPDEPSPDGSGALMGAYVVMLRYRKGRADIAPPEPPWIKETQVLGPLPSSFVLEACPAATPGDFMTRGVTGGAEEPGAPGVGAGTFYHYFRRFPSETLWTRVVCLIYRGPNVGGLAMQPKTNCEGLPGVSFASARMQATGTRFLDTVETPTALTTTAVLKLGRYNAAGIRTIADLNALTIATPAEASEWNALLPERIETLLTATVEGTFTQPAGGLIHVGPLPTGPTVPITQLTGPSLFAVELDDIVWGGGVANSIEVALEAEYLSPAITPVAWDAPSIF